jgi:hypothetical protein
MVFWNYARFLLIKIKKIYIFSMNVQTNWRANYKKENGGLENGQSKDQLYGKTMQA